MRLRIGLPAAILATAVLATAGLCPAVQLSSGAERAFSNYIASFEAQLGKRHACTGSYLAVLNAEPAKRAEIERQLMAGAIYIEPVNGGTWPVSGGLLHHWRGAAFVSGATAERMLALLRDYNHLFAYYAPQVRWSHALSDQGRFATVSMRLIERNVVTAVLDADYAVETGLTGSTTGYGISRSMHIWQIDQPGTPQEHRLPEGYDDGFLWRLNSYWSFRQVRDGLLMECDAISLTRDVPLGVGWVITPIVRSLPKTSLEFTLNATKKALLAGTLKEGH